MLDDLKYIHEKDVQDALGVAEKQSQQLLHDFNAVVEAEDIENVVLAGMGGSALAGTIATSWPGINVPFEIVRDYSLPRYVNDHTLCIISSYSGNTEEALSVLKLAEDAHAKIVVITAGGGLLQAATRNQYPLFQLPGGLQPRMATFFSLAALVQVLEPLGLVPTGSLHELREAAGWLEKQVATWRPDVPAKDNPAKRLAHELMGKSAVIYSGPLLFPAAYKWKISINENAKNVAWCNQYSELNHNEMLGWTSHPTDKPYAVVELRSQLERPEVQKRFVVTERLLSGLRPAPEVVEVVGDSLLQQILWAINFGDFVSLYLALLNGLNPTPVELIEKFKEALKT